MKKVFLAIAVLIAFSCENSDSSDLRISNAKIKADLDKINEQYRSDSQTQRSFKSWCLIFSADVSGAWAGSWAGGKIGGLFGPQGAAIGAVAGGVIVGAAASYGVSRTAPPTDRDQSDIKIATFNPNTVYANPNNNPYDISVGQRHNQIVQSLVLHNPSAGASDPNHLYDNVALTANEQTFYNNQHTLTTNWYNGMKGNNTIANQKAMIAQTVDDPALLTVMNNYLDGVYATASYSDANNLTLDYEHYVTAGSFSTTQKAELLRGFATARYSLNFWNANN